MQRAPNGTSALERPRPRSGWVRTPSRGARSSFARTTNCEDLSFQVPDSPFDAPF
jgi:hypothetical protein